MRLYAKTLSHAFKRKGFRIVAEYEESDVTLFRRLWDTEGLAVFVFGGHGNHTDGFQADPEREFFVLPKDVAPLYKLMGIYALSCFSFDNGIGGSWGNHVSKYGIFVGHSDDAYFWTPPMIR